MLTTALVSGLFRTIPITSESSSSQSSHPLSFDLTDLPPLEDFTSAVINQNRWQIVGVYVSGLFALPVTPQPAERPDYVSSTPDVITQFSLAAQYRTVGLLAHNTLAGARFSELHPMQLIHLIYGDGSIKTYVITAIHQYQAIYPKSTVSNFVDLEYPDQQISALSLFYRTYARKDRLVFQTCIAKDGEEAWGRLFVIAIPFDAETQYASHIREIANVD